MNNPNITRLVLLKTSLENDYKHTLYFTDSGSQRDYFLSRKVKDYDFTNLTYIRKDHSVKVPLIYDDVVGCNYVMYQNKSDTKWYYAFITDIKYISEGVSEIILETDCIQSWLFAYTVQPSFIEREHVSDDTIGLHTYPENVELGEFTTFNQIDMDMGGSHCVVATTWDFKRDTQGGCVIGNIYHGVNYYLMSDYQTLVYFLGMYADGEEGKSDSITGIFMVPDVLTGYDKLTTHSEDEYHWDYLSTSGGLSYFPYKQLPITDGELKDFTLYKPQNFVRDEATPLLYKPINNKLLTYPYHYLECTNNNGGSAIYRYEDFKNPYNSNACTFRTNGSITPGCSIRTVPLYYHNVNYNFEEGLNLGKFPICSYSTDMYTNWLTQNSVNIGMNIFAGASQMAIGAGLLATGAGAITGFSVGMSGLVQIGNALAETNKMSKVPPQAEGNLNCGDIVFSQGRCTYSFYQKCIKPEYMRVIDGYFNMFGYKICRVKTPSTNHRERYWYIKTIDVNIDGSIPNKDIQIIKNAYNNGITFWRNGNEIGNYSLSNNIV
jgi:hypothetical protein